MQDQAGTLKRKREDSFSKMRPGKLLAKVKHIPSRCSVFVTIGFLPLARISVSVARKNPSFL